MAKYLDEMVQLGNDSDKTRQSAILLSSYGDDAPSFKMCQGISAYSLAGKEVFCVSRKELFALADKFQFKTSDVPPETSYLNNASISSVDSDSITT
jgi:hypothetical protein